MATLRFNGRTLPLNDWEGDDFTPGAGGRWVTCMDTAVGRAACWATNGRVCVDGKVIRSHVIPRDTDGISFPQADKALRAVNKHLRVVYVPVSWNRAKAESWLRAGNGLVITGIYSSIPRAYRHQAKADFAHAMFVAYVSGTNARLYDPLNPDTHARGRTVPASVLWPFMASRRWIAGYVPLHGLVNE